MSLKRLLISKIANVTVSSFVSGSCSSPIFISTPYPTSYTARHRHGGTAGTLARKRITHSYNSFVQMTELTILIQVHPVTRVNETHANNPEERTLFQDQIYQNRDSMVGNTPHFRIGLD